MAKATSRKINGDLAAGTGNGRFLAPASMALAITLVHLKPLLTGKSFMDTSAFHHDLWACFPALLTIARDCMASGHFPLWEPYMHMGIPYLAFFIPSAIHPLAAPLLFLDFQRSLALLGLTNSLLLAAFAYVFFRRADARPWGAAGAGALLCMTGFVPWLSPIMNVNLALPWFLCWMWSAMGIAEKPGFGNLAWNLIAVMVLLLGGDPQILVEGIYLTAAWFLAWVWFRRLERDRMAAAAIVLAGAAAIGLTAALVQVMPTSLMASRLVSTSQMGLAEFAASFPAPLECLAGALGLFSRLFANLFLTFSVPLLLWYSWRRRKTAPLKASLLVAIIMAVIVAGGRLGLAAIPYHLPLLKGFFRHYKYGALLQGPLFLGVALGFDQAAAAFAAGASRRLQVIFIAALAATALAIRDPAGTVLVGAAGACFLYLARQRGRAALLPPVLFAVIIIDAGSYLWKTPYLLAMPTPDPIYLEYLRKLGPHGRVHAMYPWIARMGRQSDQPLPPQGTGYHGDYTVDPWFEYPLENHAWSLAALSDQAAVMKDQVVQRSNFVLAFKHSDFVTPSRHKFINLAAIRYFFLQDFALEEADVYPILSDPAYLANPSRPQGFTPWQRSIVEPGPGAHAGRPSLVASGYGAFLYQRDFRPGGTFQAVLKWGLGPSPSSAGPRPPDIATVIYRSGNIGRLLQARFFGPETWELAGGIQVDYNLPVSGPDKGELQFGLLPSGPEPSSLRVPGGPRWIDPRIIAPDRPLRYRGGNRVMVFENEQALGRARVVHQSLSAWDNEAALRLMISDEYDPELATVLMDPSAPGVSGGGPLPGETAEIKYDRDDALELEAKLAAPGYLVLADSYYPGWRAMDREGRDLRIYRADLNLRAVFLDAGLNTVVFTYVPADFRIGLFASLASLAALAGLGLGRAGKNFGKGPARFRTEAGRE